jgi:1-acyl-sn-glycerol-3-phosphate acyltransferase
VRDGRVIARLFGLGVGTAALFLLWLAGGGLALLAGRTAAWRATVVQLWARFVARVLRLEVSCTGTAPRGGFLLVANHVSYLDVVVLAGALRCGFVAKAEVARWPVIGFLARAMGTVFVERERKRGLPSVAAEMRAWLERGGRLVLFPEGTSTAGHELRPFCSALLAPAVELRMPVHHASLRYRTPAGEAPAAESVCWWGEMEFLPHFLALMALTRIEAELTLGREPVLAGDRKQLARCLEHAVAADLGLPPEPHHA